MSELSPVRNLKNLKKDMENMKCLSLMTQLKPWLINTLQTNFPVKHNRLSPYNF